MKILLFVGFLLYNAIAYGQVNIGVEIGTPPHARVEVAIVRPSADYYWVGGYWYPVGGRYIWHNGYWSRPPYSGAIWVAPRHDGRYYHEGYWNGNQGHVEHNHKWDGEHGRDEHHNGNR